MMNWPKEQAHLQALFEAYVAESGLPLSPSHPRKQALREMDRRGLTAADVRAVIGGIKKHLERGTKGYTDASLDWRNTMGDVDTFEERALKARQAKLRKKGAKPAPIVAHTTALPGGEKITRLGPAEASTAVDVDAIRAGVKREVEKLERTMRGGRP